MKSFKNVLSDAILWFGRHPAAADIFFIAALAVFCCGRILFLQDIAFDDDCWLLAVYNSTNLSQFLDTGARELRRVPQGVFTYVFFLMGTFLESPVLLWHPITLAIQALTAVVLYLLVRSFSGSRSLYPFLAACLFLVLPTDNTLPVFTNFFTRVAGLLSVASLLFTARAVDSRREKLYKGLALFAAVFTYYFLAEAAISLEPARFIMLGCMLRARGVSAKETARRASLTLLPFLLSALPLVAYKMLYKPYGIYAGSYETSLKFLFDFGNWLEVLKHFGFYNWVVLAGLIDRFPVWPFLLASGSGIISWVVLTRFSGNEPADSVPVLPEKKVVVLGFVLLLFPAMFYMYAGKVPSYGYESRHAILMQAGNAIMLAGALALLLRKFSRYRAVKALTAFGFAAGVFFGNLNLDQYYKTLEYKRHFWSAFTKRFPVLPERADFVFDLDPSRLVYGYYAAYQYEYAINMLYARSTERGDVRKYRVLAADCFTAMEHAELVFPGHYGRDIFDTKKLIPVAFRDGRIYVGKEILELEKAGGGKLKSDDGLRWTSLTYRLLADNPLPDVTNTPPPDYPLRARLAGYLLQNGKYGN